VVTDGGIEAMGERLVAGRLFTPRDRAGAPEVAIVNETMARIYWGDRSPIGGRIRMGGNPDRPWITVVGVVRDLRHNGLVAPVKEKFYRPHAQFVFPVRNMHLVVKTAGDPMALAAPIRDAVRGLDPNLPVANVRTMNDLVAASMAQPRLAEWVLGLFGMLALLLAAIGLYGVLSYVVSERQLEIGIRVAIGAEPSGVRRMIVRQGLALAAGGVLVGVPIALALARLAGGLLHGVAPHDAVTFAAVACVLLAVGAAASFVPAWRATRIPPLTGR
jgi:predicted permease